MVGLKDYRRMTPTQREADRERRRQGRERRAAEKEAALVLREGRRGLGMSHVPHVDAFMRRDWRKAYMKEAKAFPDLDDETQGTEDGEQDAERTWAWNATHVVRSEVPQLQMSLADLIEVAPVRRRRGGKKGRGQRAVEGDDHDAYSVLGSEAGTEMWSEMGEEELASVLAALDEEAEEEEWEQLGADEVLTVNAAEAKTVGVAR
ncbi:unnamed protein product [Peniophora sp. CBMAI 1063]|nr:unnamed protein product [Peniophora sp. CBMAI 1063]